ncbi:MAG TPA: RcpC/CpaB family pilus assembly protein [Acidimicrobiales bacterium]|nr:RcpC/CpaB family pilus assembly protein [Acidimicrobiales bacterium]
MARNRSTTLIAIGAAVFVIGAALTFLALHKDGDSKVATTAPASAQPATAEPASSSQPAAAPVTVKVPAGKEAVAIQVPAVPGLAGYAKVGDTVNVYGTFKDRQPANAVKGVPLAKLVLSSVEVLAVTAPPPGTEGGTATYLLAVAPGDAEKVVYLGSFEGIWLSLSDGGIPPTSGHNAQNVA